MVWQLTNRKLSGSALSVLLSIFVIAVLKIMTQRKSKRCLITFSQYDWFIFENGRFWLATLRDKLMRACRVQRCLDSYRQRQISQSDCEITSNCGKIKGV